MVGQGAIEMIKFKKYKEYMFEDKQRVSNGRTFYFKNQETLKVYIQSFTLSLSQGCDKLDITQVVQHFATIDQTLHGSNLWFIDQNIQRFLYLGKYTHHTIFTLPLMPNQLNQIRILFKPINQNLNLKEAQEPIKKVRERTIKQALKVVEEWLNLCNLRDQKKRKIHTLQSASAEVGVSKKTLHDYYKHIKLAEFYKFSFEQNINKKVGYMKKFIRASKLKEEEKTNPDDFWALDKNQI